jgi:MinD superfamily P-loop ATPase
MEIAIISGKGGTGKSCISAAFATIARRVVLADCDVDAANQYLLFTPEHDEEKVYVSGHKAVIDYSVCTACGVCMSHCAFDAISEIHGRVTISEVSCDGCFLCSRVCPEEAITMVPNDKSRMYSGSFRYGKMVYGRLAPGEENSGKLVQQVREKAAELAGRGQLDITILDGPPGIGCPVNSTITGVSKVVMVTEPSRSGFSDLKRVAGMAGKYPAERYVIINKADLNPGLSHEIETWCHQEGIELAGMLPFDEEVVRAMVNGQTIAEWAPGGETSTKIEKIWNYLITN